MNKKIGVLGSGIVGKTLAAGFAKHGYSVMIGTDSGDKIAELSAIEGVTAGTMRETAAFGEIIVLAVKGHASEAVIGKAGIDNFTGKTIIDTGNPIAEVPPINGVLEYYTTMNSSLLEQLQDFVPKANFVKAFSCVGAGLMIDPKLTGGKPSMFICGNSDQAKHEVKKILTTIGWETADMGKVEAARAIEPLAMLWCIPGFLDNDWAHAFKVLKP